MYGHQDDHIKAMCAPSPMKRYADSSPATRERVTSERQVGVLGIKKYVVGRMGQEYAPCKVDRQGPKSKSVIRMGDDSALPKFDAVGMKSNLLTNNLHNRTFMSSTVDGLDREKNIATYG